LAESSLQQRLRGLALSAVELRELTEWPGALIEDYLNIIDNLGQIGTTVDTGVSIDIISVTANYTTTNADGTILIDCSTGPVTVSLDTSATRGQNHTLKCIDDTYTCTVSSSPYLIDNAGESFQLFKDESIDVRADNDNDWWII
jgi:hypothetical protein